VVDVGSGALLKFGLGVHTGGVFFFDMVSASVALRRFAGCDNFGGTRWADDVFFFICRFLSSSRFPHLYHTHVQ
jgi:hypothetical protein